MTEPSLTTHEVPGSQLFEQCLADHQLPQELTPLDFAEAYYHPTHQPDLIALLRRFTTDPRTTTQTELTASHVDPRSASAVSKRYRLCVNNGNTRIQTLAYAWDPRPPRYSQYEHILTHVLKVPQGPNGDMNLIMQWMHQNWNQLEPIFFKTNNPDFAAAQIALRRGADVNFKYVNYLIGKWSDLLGPVNLASSRVGKDKMVISPQETFPRPGSSSITRQFAELFVDLDIHDPASVQKCFGLVDTPSDETMKFFQQKFSFYHLVMLSLLSDQGEPKPLEMLDRMTAESIKKFSDSMLHLVTTTSQEARKDFLNTIDPQTGRSFRQTIDYLISLQPQKQPGFGAARALLSNYTEARLQNDPQADQLEKLMQFFNLLATDIDTREKLAF